MARRFYKKQDFAVPPSESEIRLLKDRRERLSAMGEHAQYDVFLSHSTDDQTLIKCIRDALELGFNISVYVDWEEDAGTPRDEIADTVKDAMNRSKTFVVVKTDNSDGSSWVPWETGYFDNKDSDRIGVLLIEDDDNEFSHETFEHREYLKNYAILGPEDIVEFIDNGGSYILKKNAPNNLVGAPFIVVKPEEMVRPHTDG